MMEKLSAKEFDLNYEAVLKRVDAALEKSGRKREDVILLAATKTVDVDTINYAIEKGIDYIGENKVQELLQKHEGVKGAHRHFIGHLQTNKVKDIIDKVELIHSVDSVKLAKEISKQAAKRNLVMNVLLEVNVANEESKWGFKTCEVLAAVKEIATLPNVKIVGLMTIGPVCNDGEDNRKYFRDMKNMFVDIAAEKIDNVSMEILSMGMSDDFDIAIEEGATIVRMGTALFGKRIYT
jgi:pyridoxal phosphate enzyme (YggS family)